MVLAPVAEATPTLMMINALTQSHWGLNSAMAVATAADQWPF
jgi:hypothetical protein